MSVKHTLLGLVAMLSSLVAPFALAHPGHDHGHWTAEPLHVLFYAAIGVAAITATFAAVKMTKRNRLDKEEK
ncbi:MAG: hypothetical protein ACPGMR_06550 [Pontibacterium sp.]